MTDMTPPVGQSRFMLIHAPKQFMVLSIILTNRVNKRLRTVMPRTEKPATGSSRASPIRWITSACGRSPHRPYATGRL
ncbi:hypothetical protein CFBP7129_09050 [Agrobacterium tumefaciens]|uniref:Uncharacterized protein n=1 Tax=Agrobacterium tumefaciens TaxID=358 RepID=A0A4D7YKC3_AGRTU|nr:hypothetical protein CFBP7129_09050 [Agrobacterium tumefaciens]